jgi:hypothetical protein
MQRLFSSEGPWATPWMERVLPVVAAVAERFPERTVFTRFITPQRLEDRRPPRLARHHGDRALKGGERRMAYSPPPNGLDRALPSNTVR